jgi:cytochrome c peroxidase
MKRTKEFTMNKSILLTLTATFLLGCPPAPPSGGGGGGGGGGSAVPNLGDFDYETLNLPDHFGDRATGGMGGPSVIDTDNTPTDNPITNTGASLGRALFYDVKLSANQTIACASCHKAEFGFSDDRTLSQGFEGGETGRHSMSLTNARFYAPGMFFWDQRAASLEDQVLMPFQDAVEMGMTLETLVAAVEGQSFYPPLFEAAFGDSQVTPDRISKALAQFVRSLVSYSSPYDEGRAQVSSATVDFPNFSPAENLGKQIFMNTPMGPNGAGCAVCHQGETMSAAGASNNGLDRDSRTDEGYGGVTGSNADMGTFKVPSLRNVAVREGFMHDGRFSTLREVVDHYATTVEPHPNLGMPLNMHAPNLSEDDRQALVAFLKTLTDEDMLTDPKFANPFE